MLVIVRLGAKIPRIRVGDGRKGTTAIYIIISFSIKIQVNVNKNRSGDIVVPIIRNNFSGKLKLLGEKKI